MPLQAGSAPSPPTCRAEGTWGAFSPLLPAVSCWASTLRDAEAEAEAPPTAAPPRAVLGCRFIWWHPRGEKQDWWPWPRASSSLCRHGTPGPPFLWIWEEQGWSFPTLSSLRGAWPDVWVEPPLHVTGKSAWEEIQGGLLPQGRREQGRQACGGEGATPVTYTRVTRPTLL